MLKPHKDLEWKQGDKVCVETNEGIEHFILSYEQEIASWVLIPFPDDKFEEPILDGDGNANCEMLSAYGYEMLQRVA